MPERPFLCIATGWNRDAILNGQVSWEAEYLFFRIALETSQAWRFEVDPENIAHSVRCRALEPARRMTAWPLPKVAKLLSELLAHGIVRRLDYGGRCWIEVGERYQYAKGERPSEGPPLEKQAEMPLGPMLLDAPAEPPRLLGKPPNPLRRVKTKKKSDESRASGNATDGDPDSRTRALLSCGDSSRFARSEADSNDEVWHAWINAIGMPEMLQNGARWEASLKTHRRAMAEAAQDWAVMTPDQRLGIKNRAAFLTSRFEFHKKGAA